MKIPVLLLFFIWKILNFIAIKSYALSKIIAVFLKDLIQ